MGKLLGIDDARGVANADLTCELAISTGHAAAVVLDKGGKRHPKILADKGTRISSDILESALATGLCSIGANMVYLGIMSIPTVAYLMKKYRTGAGVIISASYNPCKLNDIKIFGSTGYELPDALEGRIEVIMLNHEERPQSPTGGEVGFIPAVPQALRGYMDRVRSTVSENVLKGLRVTPDCTSSSSAMTAQTLLTELGVEYHMLSDTSNGVNINDNCGPIHMETLMQYVKADHMDAGLASDGDADCCLAVGEQGQSMDGGSLMAIYALDLKSQGRLAKGAVVGAIMTDIGFIRFYEESDTKSATAKVGNRYALEEMPQKGYNFGGEQNGHIIFLDHATTDNGQMTDVQLLTILSRRRAYLLSLTTLMARYPQVVVNVTVSRKGKLRFHMDAEVNEATEYAKARLGAKNRIVVRPSGAEPLLRVMIEGENYGEISTLVHEVVDVVRERLA